MSAVNVSTEELDAIKMACEQSTLLDALTWIAVWESERVVQQAFMYLTTGVPTGLNDAKYDTHYQYYFNLVLQSYVRIADERVEP